MNYSETAKGNCCLRLVFAFGMLLCAISVAWAIWISADPVPLERLLKNVNGYIRKNPQEAKGYYVLGRLHSLAFTKGTRELNVYGDGADKLPELPSYESIITPRASKDLTPEARTHLLESIRNYQKATELDAENAKAFLGLGWVLEDGAVYADKVDPFPQAKKPNGNIAYWQAKALEAYRQAYQLSVAHDLKLEHLGPGADAAISLEAGEGIIRLLKKRQLSEAERKEIAQIERTNAEIEKKPRAVTPIIFPLDQPASLSALLTDKPVRFDLAGDGKAAWWPWVKPNVGILVWNPNHQGRITSGLQLFGSVTWWISWPNGYEPLAMLDDNGDDWLNGRELNGLAVWIDDNSNGLSETGEVVTLQKLGIARIAVQATGRSENTLTNPNGIHLRNGRYLPTYDWTPTEVKPMKREYCF